MSARVLDTGAVARLTVRTDPWLSCDDCFDAIDSVLEGMLARGEAMPDAFGVHLLGCPVCHEEADALATLVAADHGLDRFAARRVVDESVEQVARRGGRE